MLRSLKSALCYLRGNISTKNCCLLKSHSPSSVDAASKILSDYNGKDSVSPLFKGGKLVLKNEDPEPTRAIKTTSKQEFHRNISVREKKLIYISNSDRERNHRSEEPENNQLFLESLQHPYKTSGMAVLSKDTLAAILSGEVTLCLASRISKSSDRLSAPQNQSHDKLIIFPSYLCRVELYDQAPNSSIENKMIGRLVVESEIRTREQSLTLIDWEVVCEKVSHLPDIPVFSYNDESAELSGRNLEDQIPSLTSPVHVYHTDYTTHQTQNLFQLLQHKSFPTDRNGTTFGGVSRKRSVTDRANPALVAVAWGQSHRIDGTAAINSQVAENLAKTSIMRQKPGDTASTGKGLPPQKKAESQEKTRTGFYHILKNQEEEESVVSEVSETASLISKLSEDIKTLENCTIEQFVTDEVACFRRPWDNSTLRSFLRNEKRCTEQMCESITPQGRGLERQASTYSDQLDEVLNFINSEVSEIESLVYRLDLNHNDHQRNN
ncbi:hypothetical protein ACHWQZ_G001131 [Mnemiopsis leidyi]